MAQRELIPNLPPDSVFVVDNAACSLHLNSSPTSSQNLLWLTGFGVMTFFPPLMTGCASPNCILS